MRTYNFNNAKFHLSLLRVVTKLLGYEYSWKEEKNEVILDIEGTYGWKAEKSYDSLTSIQPLRRLASLRYFREGKEGEEEILQKITSLLTVEPLNFEIPEGDLKIRSELLGTLNLVESMQKLMRGNIFSRANLNTLCPIREESLWNYPPAKIFGEMIGEEDTIKSFIEQEINQRNNLRGHRYWIGDNIIYFDKNKTKRIISLIASLNFLKNTDYPTFSLWLVPDKKKNIFDALRPSWKIINEAKKQKKELIKDISVEILGLWIGADLTEEISKLGYSKADGILLKDLIDDECKFYIDKLR